MGIYERINIYGYLLWVVVLAVTLLRLRDAAAPDDPAGRSDSR
jgi:hypothetical protein